MSHRYPTEYRVPHPGHSDGLLLDSEIWADNDAEAEFAAEWRGIGERITGRGGKTTATQRLSERISQRGKPTLQDIHELTFLCFLAASAETISARSVLADSGVLHTAIHFACDIPFCSDALEGLVGAIRQMEDSIPGLRPGQAAPYRLPPPQQVADEPGRG